MTIFNANSMGEKDTGWKAPSLSSNLASGAVVRYRQIGKVVHVRISDTTTAVTFAAAPTYSNSKLVAYGLPTPANLQYAQGTVNEKPVTFYISSNINGEAGQLKFFGNTESLAKGVTVRLSFSYVID